MGVQCQEGATGVSESKLVLQLESGYNCGACAQVFTLQADATSWDVYSMVEAPGSLQRLSEVPGEPSWHVILD